MLILQYWAAADFQAKNPATRQDDQDDDGDEGPGGARFLDRFVEDFAASLLDEGGEDFVDILISLDGRVAGHGDENPLQDRILREWIERERDEAVLVPGQLVQFSTREKLDGKNAERVDVAAIVSVSAAVTLGRAVGNGCAGLDDGVGRCRCPRSDDIDAALLIATGGAPAFRVLEVDKSEGALIVGRAAEDVDRLNVVMDKAESMNLAQRLQHVIEEAADFVGPQAREVLSSMRRGERLAVDEFLNEGNVAVVFDELEVFGNGRNGDPTDRLEGSRPPLERLLSFRCRRKPSC